MADENQLKIIKEGIKVWNNWRKEHPTMRVDLSGAILRGVDLDGADLNEANLSKADLCHATLNRAHLIEANLYNTNCFKTDFSQANLTGANLQHASLVETNLDGAALANCQIYGLSAWNLNGTPQDESSLIITPKDEAIITVDDLQVAQFIYLLLNNKNIRNVIDTVTSKAVLILGRFTEERKHVLAAVREELRNKYDLIPILFDFEKPRSRDLTETISTLAHMARFIIADLSDAKSIAQELTAIVPHLPSVPVQPILLSSQLEYRMFEHWRSFPSVLPEYLYDNEKQLLDNLQSNVIDPAIKWKQKNESMESLKQKVRELQKQVADLKAKA